MLTALRMGMTSDPATGPDGKRLHTVTEIAQTAGIHRTTVYDYLNRES